MGKVGLCAMIRVSGEADTRRVSSRHFESFKSGREVRNLGEKLAKEEMGGIEEASVGFSLEKWEIFWIFLYFVDCF